MPNIFATGWMMLFQQMRRPTGALQAMFTAKPGNVYDGDKIEIDIQRFGEKVAVALRRGTGSNLNDADIVTTKEFTPPTYGEAFPADVTDLIARTAGVDPYTDGYAGYMGKLMGKLMTYFMLSMDMITRGVEVQASQILQTGKLLLTGYDGNVVYELDFKPKATHFPTTGTAWSSAGSDKLGDLEALGDVIRADGKVNPTDLWFGATAMRLFKADDQVQKQLDNRRMTIGDIMPRQMNTGAVFQGIVWIGSYEYRLWTYPEGYENAETGAFTKYIEDDKVIMTSAQTRFDRVSARVPLPLGPDPRLASLVPGRLVDRTMDLDVTPNLWCTPNGEQIMTDLKSRVLLIPVQIDGFGCLDTNP
jgi:hypothetical protein